MKKKVLTTIYVLLIIVFCILLIQLPYVMHYNRGNNLYNKGEYERAIEEYEKALSLFPWKYKECSIRINLALSMIKTIRDDDSISDKIKLLTTAKSVLCQDGCANEYDDNRS